jgi:hypothetical protein
MFDDTKGAIRSRTSKKDSKQSPKEKGKSTIHITLQRRLKIEQPSLCTKKTIVNSA